ncbi:MAG: BamA/TamA family outer membrane protein [Pseudomonadota bacterium]
MVSRAHWSSWLAFFICALPLVNAASAEPKTQLTVSGADIDLRAALDAGSLTLSELRAEEPVADAVRAAARADYAHLLAILYDHGYYAASVSITLNGREASQPTIGPEGKIDEIAVEIDPGRQFRFGAIDLSPLPAGALPPMRAGEIASTSTMREATAVSIDAWRSAGHARAQVASQSITADHGDATVDVRVRIAPGPKLRFGTISPDPISAVIPRRQLKIAGLEPGTTYDPELLHDAEKRLRRTGTFRSAVVEEAESLRGDTLPLSLSLVDRAPRRFGFGAEISTTEGGRLSAFWLHRNFAGGAERLRIDGEVSGIGGETDGADTSLAITLSRPATRNADLDAVFSATLESLREPTFESDLAEVTVGGVRREREDLNLTLDLGLRYDRSTLSGAEVTYRHGLIDLGATWDRRDDTLDPRRGTYADISLGAFVGLSSSETGFRARADLRGYRAFGERTVLAVRVQAGSVLDASLDGTPPNFRFFSGGGGSVRGQSYQSLGVPANTPTSGGLGWLGLSGEIRQDIGDSLGLVGFADAGYVSSKGDFTDGDWHGGYGLGFRYRTPLGPLRFDLAGPLSGTGDGISIYIGIGQAF